MDIPVLDHRGDTRCQAAGETHQDELDRSGTKILGYENLRVVCIEGELDLVSLVFTESVKTLDCGGTVRALLPLAGCALVEFRCRWRARRHYDSRVET